MPPPIPPFQRLLGNYKVNEITGCWEWQSTLSTTGYGLIKVFGKFTQCHRYSYELHKGAIPEGLFVLHACDNKLCINPGHLSVGDRYQNLKEAMERGLIHSGIKSPMSKQVRVKGKVYGSFKEAERALGLGTGTVNFLIRRKPHLAQLISREEYLGEKNGI